MLCEVENCGKPKFKSVITEYSALGHEYMALCDNHYHEHVTESRKPVDGYCDRCHNPEGENIKPYQDPEEGCSASYLDTCEPCRVRINGAFCD